MNGRPRDLDEVVAALDALVERDRVQRSRLGYFPALYAQTTRAVRRGVEAGAFDDADRMRRLVTAFAGRYFDARAAWSAGRQPTRSWQVPCALAARSDRVILQHVLTAINAHINLDLGIAAAEVAPGPALASLEADFRRINQVLASLLDAVQSAVGEFSPLLDLLWRVADRPDDAVLDFSFRVARQEAWNRAVLLSHLPAVDWGPPIDTFDRAAALLGRLVADPRGIARRAVAIVHHTEREDVEAVIDALRRVEPAPPVG